MAFNLAYLPGERGEPVEVAAALPMAGANVAVPRPGAPPLLAQQGTYDGELSVEYSREACALATAVGNVCELIEYPSGHLIDQRRALLSSSVDFLAEHMLTSRGYFDAPPASAGADVTVDEGATVGLDGRASQRSGGGGG